MSTVSAVPKWKAMKTRIRELTSWHLIFIHKNWREQLQPLYFRTAFSPTCWTESWGSSFLSLLTQEENSSVGKDGPAPRKGLWLCSVVILTTTQVMLPTGWCHLVSTPQLTSRTFFSPSLTPLFLTTLLLIPDRGAVLIIGWVPLGTKGTWVFRDSH